MRRPEIAGHKHKGDTVYIGIQTDRGVEVGQRGRMIGDETGDRQRHPRAKPLRAILLLDAVVKFEHIDTSHALRMLMPLGQSKPQVGAVAHRDHQETLRES